MMTPTDWKILRAVLEDPSDDLPRLAFADRLEESGHPGRAAFVRAGGEMTAQAGVECLLRGSPDEAYRAVLSGDVEGGVAALRGVSDGATPWRSLCWRWLWRRGFCDEAHMPLSAFMDGARLLFSLHPLTKVRLWGVQPWQPAASAQWHWSRQDNSGWLPHKLPGDLFDMLDREARRYVMRGYLTEQAALDALCAACVRLGRRLNVLPFLDGDTW